jgi:hypothetical protein
MTQILLSIVLFLGGSGVLLSIISPQQSELSEYSCSGSVKYLTTRCCYLKYSVLFVVHFA